MYMPCTTTSHVHMPSAPLHPMYTHKKSWKMKIEYGYEFSDHYLLVWPPIASHSNRYHFFWTIKEGVVAPFQKEAREHRNSAHFNIPPLPQYFATTLWVWARIPFSTLFPPLQTLAISLERTEEKKNTWKQLVHGEEYSRTKFEEQFWSHFVNDFCEINIKKYFFRPAKWHLKSLWFVYIYWLWCLNH